MSPIRALPSLLVAAVVVGTATISPPAAHAAPPEQPTGLSPAAGGVVEGAPVFAWERPAGATRFEFEIDDSADFSSPLTSAGTGTYNLRWVPKVQLPNGDLFWRVRAYDETNAAGPWTIESFNHVRDPAPVQIRPAADAVISPPVDSPRFAWEPVQGATSYTIEVSRDPEFVDPALIIKNTQRTTAAVLVDYPAMGTYYWRVQAELSSGYSTPWSAARPYTVAGLPAAVLTGPVDSFAPEVRDVVLDWEPVPGASTYELQISTDDAFQAGTTTVSSITGTRYEPPTTIANDEYFWRVRAAADSSNKAPWPATPWHFRRAWSDQPTLQYPVGSVPTNRPFFYQWTAMERGSEYTLLLFDSTGQPVCDATTVQTTLAGKCKPAASGTYSWKVKVTDRPSGVVTDVISQQATTFTYTAPGTVTPGSGPFDVDDVTGHAATMDGLSAFAAEPRDACTASLPATCLDLRQTPVLTWDPTPGATSYKLTISRDRELTNVVTTVSVTSPMWTPEAALPDSQAGSAYFWVVQPCGATCAPLEHAKHSFAKKTIPPTLISPVAEQQGGTTVVPTVGDDVTLRWSSELAALRAPGAAGTSSLTTPASTEARQYNVQVGLDPTFQTNVIETTMVDQTSFTSATNTYPEGPVYWRVQALDGTGNPTVWSQPGSFVKRSPVPTLVSPTPGAALGVDYAFTWQPLLFAAAYEVEIYAGPSKVGGSTSWRQTTWAPSEPFPVSDAGYTWRVRRIDARGRKGDWSETRAFTIAALTPSTIAPATGAVVPPSTGYFSWEPDALASSYRFERRKAGTTSLSESVPTRATSWAPTETMLPGSWEWRVVVLDTRSTTLGASPWQPFTVIDPPAEVTKVSISGSGKVNTELLATAPTFDPVVSTTTYQWFRSGSPIGGATGTTYTVTSSDLGQQVTVRATGLIPGYRPAVSTSNTITGANGDALVAVQPPTITGQRAVGKILTAAPGVWPDSPTITTQWLRDGQVIQGATGSTYTLTVEDAGRLIRVRETATLPARVPGTAQSTPVDIGKVASITTLALSSPTATVKQRLTASSTVAATGVYQVGGSVTFYDGSKKLKTVQLVNTALAEVKLPKLTAGKHKIKAVYSGGPQTNPSSKTVKLTVTKR